MTQIQSSIVYEPHSFGLMKHFRRVNGVVQVEKSQVVEYLDNNLIDHINELTGITAVLKDATIDSTPAIIGYDGFVVQGKTFVAGWSTILTKAEAKVAATLTWDN